MNDDEWFEDFLGLDPEDLAEIANDSEEVLSEEEERQRHMIGFIAFNVDEAYAINQAIDNGDFDELYGTLHDTVKQVNATCRASGWDPRTARKYER